MTQFIPFVPSPRGPFSFSVILDGDTYQITVPWNAYGKRFYVQCIGNGNVPVFTLPLIGSPDNGDINIAAGYFLANTLVFRVSSQTFEIGPQAMRYYRIEVTNAQGQPLNFQSLNGSGMPPGVITSALPDGTINPGALNIELDLAVYNAAVGDTTSYVRIWGLSLAELASGFNLNGQKIKIFGGMAKGYPLANPQQAGLLVQGEINQAFGNWIGTDMTLDMYLRASTDSIDSPANYTFTWAKGEPLSAMIQRTLKVVAPNQKLAINISGNRVANQDKPGVVATFTQFAQAVSNMSGGQVNMSSNGQTIFVYENSTANQSNAKQIQFSDLLGQVTWAEPQVLTAKLVMRGDLNINDVIQFPTGLIVSTSQNAMPAFGGTGSQHPANSLTFSGKFQIIQVQHWGNFRQPDAMSWNTTVWASRLLTDTQTPEESSTASGGATAGTRLMATNAQKTPMLRTFNDAMRQRAGNRQATTGKTYPCTVTKVMGSIVTVKFEIDQPPFTLPPSTMPVFGPEYIRYPIQVGCKGMAVAADAFIGAMSGLGSGTADLSEPPNLSALVFLPMGNVGFSSVDPDAIVLYGPNGVVLKAMSGLANITLTPNEITLAVGSVSIVINGSGVTIQGKAFLPHTHGGVVTGGSNTTGVT